MTPRDWATSASTLLSLLALWLLVIVLFRQYSVDRFRSRVFALRDEMFDFAADGHVAFDAPAYTMLRSTMNGFIRVADRIGIFSSLLLIALVRERADRDGRDFDERFARALEDLPEAARSALLDFRRRMHRELTHQVLAASPLMLLVLTPILCAFALSYLLKIALPQLALSVLRVPLRIFRRGRTWFFDRTDTAVLAIVESDPSGLSAA